MLKFFKKLLCGVVSLQMALVGVPAHANTDGQIDCSKVPSLGAASNTLCAVAQVGSQSVAYPLLNWATAASADYTSIVPTDTVNYMTELKSATEVRGGVEARMLGVSANEAVALATLLPTNTPWVVGRYTPETATLRIDIYRVEKRGNSVSILTAPFTPAHGDYWRASGAYITAAQRANNALGVNPFAEFRGSDGNFHNISFGAARVALGHAVRQAQAPVGLMAFVYTDLKHQTQKSGNAFRKKYTTHYWGRAVTKWYVGYPMDFGASAAALPEEPYCVGAASGTTCAAHQVARSSLAFEEFTGGTFQDGSPVDAYGKKTATGELAYYDKDVQKGWGFLAILAISFVFTFGANPLLTFANGMASGLGASGSLELALAGVGAAAEAGLYAVEASAAVNVINGADLGTPVTTQSGLGLPTIVGLSKPATIDYDNHYGKAVQRVTAKTLAPAVDTKSATQDPAEPAPTSTALNSLRTTLVGNCELSKSWKDCGADSGVLVRRDQHAPTNLLRVWKEGNPVRSSDALPPVYGN